MTITSVFRPLENPLLPSWIGARGLDFDWETFQIAGLLPDAPLRTSELKFGRGSLRPALGRAEPTPVDHSGSRYVRVEGRRTSALLATTRGQIQMRSRGDLVPAPSRQF